MSDSHIALNRFGLGARPGEPGRLSDPRGWLLDQLEDGAPVVEGGPSLDRGTAELFRGYLAALQSRDEERIRSLRQEVGGHRRAEMSAVLTTRLRTERPFAERWVAFWSNHLCISAADGFQTSFLAGAYEREAIRPHVFGTFGEMLLASARHPAMLYYLDNVRSVGPESMAARRPVRGQGAGARALRGLNENYARELLELHTVGVDGGYDQTDVESLARILTGWGVDGVGPNPGMASDGGRGDLGFRFSPLLHEPGRKRVMGETYPEGEEGGVRVIRDLARHPSTARFLAEKMATHFIDDVPPASAIDALERTWLESKGDLRVVAGALIGHDAAWDPGYRKFRTPQDWLVALLRAVDAPDAGPSFPQILQQLRHPMWAPPSPKGFGDLRREWADADALMNRAELARTLARRAGRSLGARAGAGVALGRGPDLRPLGTTMALGPGDPLPGMLADDSIPADERIALAFAGPAFQWR
jgi:uncharacterized protein (DUF1800 family)